MGIIGITALNAKSYVATIIQYTSLVSGAVGTGVGILMGRYAGKNEFDKMKKLSRTALLFAVGANVLFSLSVYFLRIPLISAFTENTEIYRMITPIFLLDVLVEFGRAVNHVLERSLIATKDILTTFTASLASCWIGSVLLSFVFGVLLGYGLVGCWIAFALDEFIKAFIYAVRWKNGKWKKHMF